MKKSLSVLVAAVFVLSLAAVAMAGTLPGSGIIGTSHDLSSTGLSVNFGDSVEQVAGMNKDRICIYCHAPHNTKAPGGLFTYMPLWNHETTLNAGAFTNYSNGSDNALFGTQPINLQHQSTAMLITTQPGSVSLLCLSCHDGSVATNEYGFAPSLSRRAITGATQKFIDNTNKNIIGNGGDLSNHHPIGFDYVTVQGFDPEIADITAPVSAKSTGPTMVGELLWAGGTMECVSCHDVHNTQNAGLKFTWVDDAQSALCLTCHLKGNNTP